MSDNLTVLRWEVVADRVRRNVFGRQELAWVERQLRDCSEDLARWLDLRSEADSSDSECIMRLVSSRAIASVRGSEIWNSVRSRGFVQTWENFRSNEILPLQLATILYSSELLDEVDWDRMW